MYYTIELKTKDILALEKFYSTKLPIPCYLKTTVDYTGQKVVSLKNTTLVWLPSAKIYSIIELAEKNYSKLVHKINTITREVSLFIKYSNPMKLVAVAINISKWSLEEIARFKENKPLFTYFEIKNKVMSLGTKDVLGAAEDIWDINYEDLTLIINLNHQKSSYNFLEELIEKGYSILDLELTN